MPEWRLFRPFQDNCRATWPARCLTKDQRIRREGVEPTLERFAPRRPVRVHPLLIAPQFVSRARLRCLDRQRNLPRKRKDELRRPRTPSDHDPIWRKTDGTRRYPNVSIRASRTDSQARNSRTETCHLHRGTGGFRREKIAARVAAKNGAPGRTPADRRPIRHQTPPHPRWRARTASHRPRSQRRVFITSGINTPMS